MGTESPAAVADSDTEAESQPEAEAVADPKVEVEPELVDTDGDGANDKDDVRPEDPKIQTEDDIDTDGDGVADYKPGRRRWWTGLKLLTSLYPSTETQDGSAGVARIRGVGLARGTVTRSGMGFPVLAKVSTKGLERSEQLRVHGVSDCPSASVPPPRPIRPISV